MNEKTHYQLLGVSATASKHEIKQAYRSLAKELHPDVTSNSAHDDRFKMITNAYHTLCDGMCICNEFDYLITVYAFHCK